MALGQGIFNGHYKYSPETFGFRVVIVLAGEIDQLAGSDIDSLPL